ncbi:GDYXXLXY domain-containing protein [Diaphorobacter ruginosibacter]|uniref:GDYXXLXY domain-containing protein n=1 Tax=Diaphorobacter ruginosibacter TaxID=1715720 RepID=UPI00334273BB
MNADTFASRPAWWQRARGMGLVHGDAPCAMDDDDPNVFIVALALLGALVCTLLAGGLLFSLFDSDFWLEHPAAYAVSALGIIGAGMMLRRTHAVFATCLALVLWGAFTALFLMCLLHDVHGDLPVILTFSGAVAVLQWAGALIARTLWIKRIMGFVFALALYVFLAQCVAQALLPMLLQAGGVLMAGLWLAWLRKEPRLLGGVARAPALKGWAAFADSAAVGLIAMLAWGAAGDGSGYGPMYPLFGVRHPGDGDEVLLPLYIAIGRGWASLLVLAATGLLYARWKKAAEASRQALSMLLGCGALLAVAAWFSPSLGLVALMASGALAGGRWRIAALCGLAALWALSMFYYSLAWTLAQKGLGLALMGAVLLAGLFALRVAMSRGTGAGSATSIEALPHGVAWSRARLACLIAGAVLVFGLVNWDVRGKEQVIADGRPVLVGLVPVDPRSLMQGDYMALNFDLPAQVLEELGKVAMPSARVIASLDEHGRATVRALAGPQSRAGSGEIILPLKYLKGRWVLVTDAYFFPEGQGRVFEAARYGDFRVLPDGRALLVGLADAEGAPIPVPRAAAHGVPD